MVNYGPVKGACVEFNVFEKVEETVGFEFCRQYTTGPKETSDGRL